MFMSKCKRSLNMVAPTQNVQQTLRFIPYLINSLELVDLPSRFAQMYIPIFREKLKQALLQIHPQPYYPEILEDNQHQKEKAIV